MIDKITKIYIHTPKWFLRPKNTDWRYSRFMIPRIGDFAPQCVFFPSSSNSAVLRANARYVRHYVCRKLKISQGPGRGSILDRNEFNRSACDVVFCHDDFPNNANSIRVVWQNSILDPEMMLARGVTNDQLAIEREEKKRGFEGAVAVQVSTEAERDRLSRWFPGFAKKFLAIPFFMPDLKPISQDLMNKKLERKGPLRCLFVGHEAKRKGLDRVYAAIERLPPAIQKRIHLTVVSKQIDGPITAPSLPNLRITGELSNGSVLQLMQESDIFLMPSYFESYGLVYLEAMAQGTIPVVPDWEVQREIVDYGNAGIVTSGDAGELATSLERLIDDDELRSRLAASAKHRFEHAFAPAIVAKRYSEMFRLSAGH